VLDLSRGHNPPQQIRALWVYDSLHVFPFLSHGVVTPSIDGVAEKAKPSNIWKMFWASGVLQNKLERSHGQIITRIVSVRKPAWNLSKNPLPIESLKGVSMPGIASHTLMRYVSIP
jgi:hypothetical protein